MSDPLRLADEIISNLQSAATTTAETLKSLRALLGDDDEPTKLAPKPAIISAVSSTRPQTLTKAAPKRNAKNSKAPKIQPFEIYETADSTLAPLTTAHRRKLATDAFNTSLKCLTRAVKAKQERDLEAGNLDNKTATQKKTPRSIPLQQCSPNRKSKPSRPTCKSQAPDDDIGSVAGCAAIALASLRNFDASNTKMTKTTSQTLRQGALVLAEKLVSLGITEQATTELCSIHRQQYSVDEGWPSTKRQETQQSNKTPSAPVLVECDVSEGENSSFEFVCSYQSQVLRLNILLGSRTLTEQFVTDIQMMSQGSPANVVLRGHDAGLVNGEKAGQHLRTIAQALIKLYSLSIADKHVRKENDHINLKLLVEALKIKSRSWKLLCHSPNLDREFWSLVLKGIKRYDADREDRDQHVFPFVSGQVRELSSTLQQNGMNADSPIDLVHLLVDMAEKEAYVEEGLKMLRVCSKSSCRRGKETQALLSWRVAMLHLRQSDRSVESLQPLFDDVLKSFSSLTGVSFEHIGTVLLYGARLRKAAVHVVQNAISASEHDDIGLDVLNVCITCINLILHLLSLFSDATIQEQADPAVKVQVPSLTTFAKTFEAILDLRESCNMQHIVLSTEIDRVVQKSIDMSTRLLCTEENAIREPQVVDFTTNLLLRASHLYWTQYLELSSRGSSSEDILYALKQSCTAVASLPSTMRNAAAIGMKLEKLAVAYLAIEQRELARQSFEDAIDHYLACGALNAPLLTLSGSSRTIWFSRGTQTYLLGKALGSHARLCLTYGLQSSSTKSWFYDNDSLDPTQRVLIAEAQILVIADHNFDPEQSLDLEKHLRAIIGVSTRPQLRNYRLRLISRLLFVLARNQTLISIDLSSMCDFQELIESPGKLEAEILLAPYTQSMSNLVALQWFMHIGTFDMSKFRKHLRSLSSIILGTTDIDALDLVIDDVEILLKHLQAVFNYGRMLDDAEITMNSLRATRHTLVNASPCATMQLADTLTHLASLHTRLDNTTEAEKTFIAAEKLLVEGTENLMVKTRWAVAYAEHLIGISNTAKAMELYQQTASSFETAGTSAKETVGRQRLEKDSLVGRSAYLASQAAMQMSNLALASQFAKQAVKISNAIWQAIEKPSNDHVDQSSGSGNSSSIQNLTSDLSNLTISSVTAPLRSQSRGSTYWNYVDLHCTALHNMADMSMHNGLYQDALSYAEQLRKVANTIKSPIRAARSAALLALIYAKGGQHTQATGLLKDCELLQHHLTCTEDRHAALWTIEAYIETGNPVQAAALLDLLEAPQVAIDETTTAVQPAKTGINKAPVRGRAKTVRPIKTPAKRPGKLSPANTQEDSNQHHISQSQLYVAEKCRSLRTRAALLHAETSTELSPPLFINGTTGRNVESSTMMAMIMLQKALHELSSDSVKCVLSETAVALPVRYKSARKSGRVSFIQADQAPATAKALKHSRTRSTAVKATNKSSALSTGEQLVVDARSLLQSLQSKQKDACGSDTLHLAYRVQSKLALLSSTINVPFSMSSLDLVVQSLTPKNVVQDRERLTVAAERATREKAQVLAWPDTTSLDIPNSTKDLLDHTEADLADLPKTWSVIAISLAENQQEILMSKITANQSPFLLRVPLSRADLEVEQDNELTFQEAKAELMQIMIEANASAHDKRGSGDREARKEWYSEREALDTRLGEWLYSIENMWLGGFRGLMCSDIFDDSLVTKFGQSLNRTLDQHLPSRQKSGTKSANKVVLHAHVLELFLGLGDPDQQEIDDAATDLLYFVVDILQFSGEHNAYDEIDFDAMLVEVLDALRSCYDAISTDRSRQHTILIVDKELASFPWESLPCLQSQSVSRMPSLNSVLQRLKKIRTQSPTSQGYTIPADQGSYILNPSSDLVSTQSTFQPIFQSQLPSFHSSVNRPPTESSFTSRLTTSPLLLYFGHGSGAQYIRGRTIRNLDACAVTLLMGCSSAKMTEAGKFESYGMPGYYIGGMSECMAVVGTLWDVTDRDIDRFALKTLVEWGLLDEDELVEKALERSHRNIARKGGVVRKTGIETRRGNVSLDQAVSLGRDACLLRYLNGAAPVVYGVPVYLQ